MTKEQYQEYLKSCHWQEFRQTVLATTSRCAACDSKKRINVHHRHYRSLHRETTEDVVVLCRACHGYLHEDMKKGMTQDAWLRLHCPKLYGGIALKVIKIENLKKNKKQLVGGRGRVKYTRATNVFRQEHRRHKR